VGKFLAGVTEIKERYPRLNGLHRRMKNGYLSDESDKPLEDWESPEEGFDEEVFKF